MKILKIALLILSTALIFSCNKKSTEATTAASTASQNTSATARTGGDRGDRPRGQRGGDQAARAEAMYAALNLSEPQLVKVKAIGQKYQEQMQALRQSGSREGMREKMQALRTSQNEELKGVMTTEQFTKYLKMMEEARGKRGGRGGGQRGGGGK